METVLKLGVALSVLGRHDDRRQDGGDDGDDDEAEKDVGEDRCPPKLEDLAALEPDSADFCLSSDQARSCLHREEERGKKKA